MTNTTHTHTDLPSAPKPPNSTGVPADNYVHHFTDGRFTTWVATVCPEPDELSWYLAESTLEALASEARRGGPDAEASFYGAVAGIPFNDFGPRDEYGIVAFAWNLERVLSPVLLDVWHGEGTWAEYQHGMMQADLDWADR